jgi:hypothetical protein
MRNMIGSSSNAEGAVFYSVPANVVPGAKVSIFYDRSRTILKCAPVPLTRYCLRLHNLLDHLGFCLHSGPESRFIFTLSFLASSSPTHCFEFTCVHNGPGHMGHTVVALWS